MLARLLDTLSFLQERVLLVPQTLFSYTVFSAFFFLNHFRIPHDSFLAATALESQ